MASQAMPHPPLPPGWRSEWSVSVSLLLKNSTGRSQYNFPASGPLPPPGQRPFPGVRHGAHASVSGPLTSTSPINGFTRQPLSGYGAGGRAPIPPYAPAAAVPSPDRLAQQQQQQQQPQSVNTPPPAAVAGMSNTPPPPALSPAQDPSVARRPGRRQYARDTATYIAGDMSGGPSASSGPGHGHSQSTAGFFSPAAAGGPAADPAAGQFFTPGAAPGSEFVQPGGPSVAGAAGAGIGGAPASAGGAGYGAAQLTNQFGQMGIGGVRQQSNVSTVDLIKTPLNPLELMTMQPPEIRLPPNASFSQSETRNADPSYQRMTINAIPTTNTLLQKSKLPLALVLTPYRSLKPGDPEVPVVSDTVIARCRRCRTYINPYVTFIEGGQRWKCCMCNLSNEVPQLFDWDQEKNQPADRYARHELNSSVVEFVAPTEYMEEDQVRAPQPPIYVFVIDVSYSAVSSGMVATAARTLLESLDRLPNEDSRTKIAVIGVDSCLHFFTLAAGSTDPAMLVVGDLDDVFLPKPNDILVNLVEAKAGIENLLGRLNDMFHDTHNTGNALGAGLQAAFKLIVGYFAFTLSPSANEGMELTIEGFPSHVGGKIVALSASLPNLGPGSLKNREDSKVLGTSKESALLQAQTGFYKTFAIDCSRSQVSVDMWLFSSAYTDVATLSGLPRYTGGQTFYYPSFNAARSEDALKFAHEFGTVISDPICLEAVMRVRASRGIRMSAFHGNFFVRSTDLLSLPAVPMDQSYAIEIQIEDPINAPFVVFQTAVLHTTCYGERRIRVITLALPTTSSISELYASVDTVALATLLANKAVERSTQSKLEDARDAVQNKLVDILGTYKATMTSAGSGASPQLVISDNMKFLPLLMLGLLKNVRALAPVIYPSRVGGQAFLELALTRILRTTGLRHSTMIPSDVRAYAQALLTTLPSQLLIPYLHPVFYSLHNMPKECGTISDAGVILPHPLPLSSERLERHGLFLIEDGQNIFLWVGRDAVPQLVMDVFDLPSYADLMSGKRTLPVLDNAFSQRVNAIIGKVREARRGPYYPHLYIVKEDGDPALRQWALSCLIEDRLEATQSYGQFIGMLKDKINDKSF
ncbi:SPOSA6832_00524 [Sporobolomyces salmonicolor]|uniref:SPOSA6832_00524-mRNA-1:cds n=1 Tax=Sporidiobolus salmonicolor TaxID=5005 RepID=A0A0D6EG75_SPOSA|nr:SPOSA6832_00524 [Sporobolomyces salmonicolor]